MDWISVEDKKPNSRYYLPVICRHDTDGWTDAGIIDDNDKWFNIEGCEIFPTHWIPLGSFQQLVNIAYWIPTSNNPNVNVGMKCSACKARIRYSEFYNGNHNFCYKCGAKMIKKQS